MSECQTCGKEDQFEVVETHRRFSDSQTGQLKYKTATVWTVCRHCQAITNYATSGKLTAMGVPIDE